MYALFALFALWHLAFLPHPSEAIVDGKWFIFFFRVFFLLLFLGRKSHYQQVLLSPLSNYSLFDLYTFSNAHLVCVCGTDQG